MQMKVRIQFEILYVLKEVAAITDSIWKQKSAQIKVNSGATSSRFSSFPEWTHGMERMREEDRREVETEELTDRRRVKGVIIQSFKLVWNFQSLSDTNGSVRNVNQLLLAGEMFACLLNTVPLFFCLFLHVTYNKKEEEEKRKKSLPPLQWEKAKHVLDLSLYRANRDDTNIHLLIWLWVTTSIHFSAVCHDHRIHFQCRRKSEWSLHRRIWHANLHC